MRNYDDEIGDLRRRLRALENIRGGPGISIGRSPGGLVIAARPRKEPNTASAAVAEDNTGGTLLVLDRTNPETAWSRSVDKCPVSWIGNYTTWDTDEHKFVQHERTMTYDRGGNLTAISAERQNDIVEAEVC